VTFNKHYTLHIFICLQSLQAAEEQEQMVLCILSVPPSGFLRGEPGFQALAEPLESPLVLRMFLLDLVDNGVNGPEPVLQLLLLVSPGLFSAAQGSVLPFLQCLQMLLACLVGHNLQQVLRKATTEMALRANCTQKGTKKSA